MPVQKKYDQKSFASLIGRLLLAYLLAFILHDTALAQATRGWTHVPKLLVVGQPDDPRLQLIREAVEHWNSTLQDLGTGFRLGAIEMAQADIPADYLLAVSRAMARRTRDYPEPPPVLAKLPGDLIVVLSDLNFISFGLAIPGNKRVVAIKGMRHYPMLLPNVALNVVIHEFGHGIGLGHNSDPAALMCGRPSSCEPQLFQSNERKIFPLLDSDKQALLKLYPPDWKPQ